MKISVNLIFDQLSGGLESGIITSIYGPASSGKTCLCLIASINNRKKVVYIDTEENISIDRLKQLTDNHHEVLDRIIIIKPDSLKEQKKALLRLSDFVNEEIGLIIIDSIATPYRLDLNDGDSIEVNREIGRQLGILANIAKKYNIPVLITNQVYSAMDNTDNVRMVGGDLLGFSCKCLIELKKFKNMRIAILKKHRSLPEGKEIKFNIVEKGIESVSHP